MFVELPIILLMIFSTLLFRQWYQTGEVFNLLKVWNKRIVLMLMIAAFLFGGVGFIAILSGLSFEPTQGGYLVRYESMLLKVLMK
uniref:Uncharacterized protein n=1 Tax=Pseudomonas phage RVTF4 TaxID=3236931 RepID=A0AB39CD12_9VIRU